MPLKAISLFTGMGGLDWGLEAAGFSTAAAVECDASACRAIRLNRRWPVIEDDVTKVASQDILSKASLKAGEADLLAGGPPCQPFSKTAYWVSREAILWSVSKRRRTRCGQLHSWLRCKSTM